MSEPAATEYGRRAALIAAEGRANELLDAIEHARLIAQGRTERMVEEDIYVLAERRSEDALRIANDLQSLVAAQGRDGAHQRLHSLRRAARSVRGDRLRREERGAAG